MTKTRYHPNNEFALYKGENILCIGTISEIANHQNISEETVKFYGRPAYIKRRQNANAKDYKILIDLDDN